MEFLPDELVEYDVDEFLSDEFVIDETTTDSSVGSVGFAGPSDAPPPYPATHPVLVRSSRPDAGVGQRAKRPLRSGRVALALACVAGLAIIALVNRVAPEQTPAVPPAASAEPPSRPSLQVVSSVAAASPAASPASASSASPASSDTTATPESVSSPAETEPPALLGDAADQPAADAIDLKHRAQQALEKGKLAPAIELGEQAVEADPTDAESWLILGATYLQRGRYGDARRCFARCVDQATHGPTSECKALLR
ncbi:MAG: tetratricopeptide repeat protein [Polyangiaceae bacterium]